MPHDPAPTASVLGTTFAGRRRGPGDAPLSPESLLDEAAGCGAGGLLLCEGLPGELLAPLGKALSRGGDLPVLAVDGQLGAALRGRPRLGRASLASLDKEEGRAAAERTLAALDFAEALGAGAVFVQLGPVASVVSRWDGLRRRFLRGELMLDEEPAERLMTERSAAGAAHLPAVLRALEPMLAQAARRGVTILLRSPRRGIDLPTPLELRVLLEELQGGPVAPLLDLPAAHLCSAMRLVPLRDSIVTFGVTGGGDPEREGAAPPLALLGDACGAVGALAPGRGEVDVAAVARFLPARTRVALLPWAGLSLGEVGEALRGVAALPRRKPPQEVLSSGP